VILKGYKKNSPEREELAKWVKKMSSEQVEVPIIIGGKEIRTGKTANIVMPHNHQHVLGTYHKADKEELYRLTEKLSVISQIENLLTYPSVKAGVTSGEIDIHGWMYDIASGEIEYYDPESSQFISIESIKTK